MILSKVRYAGSELHINFTIWIITFSAFTASLKL